MRRHKWKEGRNLETRITRVDSANPDPALIRQGADILRRGGLVAFPTETVYGLGANALDAAAVARIFEAKGRPATNPIIVHVADTGQAAEMAAEWPEQAERLAERFWPGPLTLVVPRRSEIPDVVTAGGPTVAVRCPAHPVAAALLGEVGFPVAAPSANRSTELSPTRAEHVLRSLNGRIDLVLDGGFCPGGIESTVVDVTCGRVRILRPGMISVPMLEAVVGKVDESRGGQAAGASRSPGQLARHYAPRTPLRLTDSVPEAMSVVSDLCDKGRRVGLFLMPMICGDEYDEVGPGEGKVYVKYMPCTPVECAAELYDILHGFDRLNLDAIVVDLPPDTPEWTAIRDRLLRAAHR